jgi:hypothetical protein
MNLESNARDRLEYLLGKSRLASITKSEENELRNILCKVTPSSKDLDLDAVIRLGLLLTGARILITPEMQKKALGEVIGSSPLPRYKKSKVQR